MIEGKERGEKERESGKGRDDRRNTERRSAPGGKWWKGGLPSSSLHRQLRD